MSDKSIATIATMGIDIGKNSFHVVGLDRRGAIVLRQKWSRGRWANYGHYDQFSITRAARLFATPLRISRGLPAGETGPYA